MSVVSVVNARLAKSQADKGQTPVLEPKNVDPGILAQLVLWIPTESIAVYIAVLPALKVLTVPAGQQLCGQDFSSRWWLLGGVAAGTLVFLWGWAYGTARRKKVAFAAPWFGSVACPVAFVAWALALPETPLQSSCGYDTAWGAAILTVTTVVIATVAWIFGQSAPSFNMNPE